MSTPSTTSGVKGKNWKMAAMFSRSCGGTCSPLSSLPATTAATVLASPSLLALTSLGSLPAPRLPKLLTTSPTLLPWPHTMLGAMRGTDVARRGHSLPGNILATRCSGAARKDRG